MDLMQETFHLIWPDLNFLYPLCQNGGGEGGRGRNEGEALLHFFVEWLFQRLHIYFTGLNNLFCSTYFLFF